MNFHLSYLLLAGRVFLSWVCLAGRMSTDRHRSASAGPKCPTRAGAERRPCRPDGFSKRVNQHNWKRSPCFPIDPLTLAVRTISTTGPIFYAAAALRPVRRAVLLSFARGPQSENFARRERRHALGQRPATLAASTDGTVSRTKNGPKTESGPVCLHVRSWQLLRENGSLHRRAVSPQGTFTKFAYFVHSIFAFQRILSSSTMVRDDHQFWSATGTGSKSDRVGGKRTHFRGCIDDRHDSPLAAASHAMAVPPAMACSFDEVE
jgi:hypothetical protein